MSASACTRIVVKVGTSTLTDDRGRIDRAYIADLTAQLSTQRGQGRDVILVSSGAIQAGREALAAIAREQAGAVGLPAGAPVAQEALPFKQAAAAVGQGRLIHLYTEAFSWCGNACAQVLLTREDLSDRGRFLNARNTFITLLSLGVVPVVNENDTVAVDEIKFGDNDMLAALVATLVDADLLLILSDVDGLYDRPPHTEYAEGERPSVVPVVRRIDDAVSMLAGGSVSGVGTGGMRTKVEAARIATAAGIRCVVAHGRHKGVVQAAVTGDSAGTTFLPCDSAERMPARKRWIAHSARTRGSVTVNPRASEKLIASGVSLLAVGIVDVAGRFAAGDLVEIRDEAGRVFARGIANYAAADVRRMVGLRSEQFESVLGYRGCDEIVHRDNLVVEASRLHTGQTAAPAGGIAHGQTE